MSGRALSKREQEIRRAVADYIRAEGCACCRDTPGHEDAGNRLGELLQVPMYPDESGYDFLQFVSKP